MISIIEIIINVVIYSNKEIFEFFHKDFFSIFCLFPAKNIKNNKQNFYNFLYFFLLKIFNFFFTLETFRDSWAPP